MMLRGSFASMMLLLLATPRAILAERPSSRNLLAADAAGAVHEDMADGELQRLEGELVDMQRKVHAVQQQRAASHGSTGPTSVQRSSSTAIASALGQAAVSASSGNEASETQVLKRALDVAVKALVDQAQKKSVPPVESPVAPEKTAAATAAPDKTTVPAEDTAEVVGKENKVKVQFPNWARELNLTEKLPEYKEPKLPKQAEKIPAFDYDKILDPVWNATLQETKKTVRDAEAARSMAKSLNQVPDAVDKKVKDMNAFVDRAKQAYVDQTKDTIQHVKKKPDEALEELRQDSPLEFDKDLEFDENVDSALSGENDQRGEAYVQEGYTSPEFGETPMNGAL